MSNDITKPAAPAPKPEPRLVSITFPNALTLSGINPIQGITIGDKGWTADRVMVTATSVWLHPPGGDRAVELARSSCLLRWDIEGMTLEEAVRRMGR